MPELLFKTDEFHEIEGIGRGIAANLNTDSDGERLLDWPSTVAAFKDWSERVHSESSGRNYGNIRFAHTTKPVGRLLSPPEFDDVNHQVIVNFQIDDPETKHLMATGTIHGLSIGGSYQKRVPQPDGTVAYIPRIEELSVCDRGAVP